MVPLQTHALAPGKERQRIVRAQGLGYPKIDRDKGSVTIAHGPVQSMNLPAIVMSFKLKDKAMLDRVKQDDNLKFAFVRQASDYTISMVK